MDDQNKNLILATALSFLVILVWFVLFPPPTTDPSLTQNGGPVAEGEALTPPASGTSAEGTAPTAAAPATTREETLAQAPRVPIDTPSLSGSISLAGGRIDDLKLTHYRTTLDPEAEIVTLLSPSGSPGAYYALYGWVGQDGLPGDAVPGLTAEWQVESGETLTPSSPVTLRWDNGAGLIFRRTVAVDDQFLFTITQSVENNTEAAVRLFPYGIIAREGEPQDLRGFFILHEGLVQATDGEMTFDDYGAMEGYDQVPAEGGTAERKDVVSDGWIGFTDHYWMTTLIPQNGQGFTAVAKFVPTPSQPYNGIYQADMRLPSVEVAPGATAESQTHFFAGAKEWDAISGYEESLGVDKFVDSIDWGWFFFLTKPIFLALHWLHIMIGNMGWAIIGLTVVIKALLFPLAYKSYVSMSRMKMLQPEMEKIKERAGDDRQKLQQEMMALYKKEKVNPASGCLPILVQIPIFFSLYKVIFVTIELRHEPFFGWIRDLSAPDPSSWLNLFGLLPYDVGWAPVIISIGVWPVLMGVTMWMQQKLNPAPTDPTQAMVFAWLPWVFMFMLGSFASGLVIYWTANNTITFIQQYIIMRSQGAKPDIFGNITRSFKKKKEKAD